MVIGIPKETAAGEYRVAMVPDMVPKFKKLGYDILVESGAGTAAHFLDVAYKEAGAELASSPDEVYKQSDLVLKVQRPDDNEMAKMKAGSTLVSFMYALNYPEAATAMAEKKVNTIAMDFIPRTTLAQKMDALSSQANLAGYKAVLLCANEFGKIFPLMMTAAGTITPAKVVVMGAGVAGLQALGTAKRLGAVVEVSDVRTAVKEEVQSLGGKFIEVEGAEDLQDERGYAKEASAEFLQKQKETLFRHITNADIIITTALIPGRKAPVLVTEEMIKAMRPGSVILDMAVEFGGNVELSESGKVVEKHEVKIIGYPNLPSLVATQSSDLYCKNLYALVQYLTKEGNFILNLEDEIVKNSLIVNNGEVINPRILEVIKK